MDGNGDTRLDGHSKDQSVFRLIAFHIVESDALPHERALELKESLERYGAIQYDFSEKDMNSLTHVITATIDFEGYDEAEDRMLAIVRPEWVDDSLAKKRVANPRIYSPDPRLFFSGLVFCVADLPEGDSDAIIGGVVAMGALYSGALSKQVTHIVALGLDAPLCQAAITKNLPCQVVLPCWFDDCLRLGRRIDERPYLLPDPEILRLRPYDQLGSVPRPDLRSELVAPLSLPPEPSGRSPHNLDVFQGKRVLLSQDLGVTSHLRSVFKEVISEAKGQVVRDISDADVLICKYRDGEEYTWAFAHGKTIASLLWLYRVIIQNTWTSPTRRLLHYPVGRGGIPAFKNFRISLSNYSGEARIYLENLAKAAGCDFTKTMKADNTHLVTALPQSEKCEAAREWGVYIVNHLWLEESYAKGRAQDVLDPRYVCFPPRTILGEVVGLTTIDKEALGCFNSSQKDRTWGEPVLSSETVVGTAEEEFSAPGPTQSTPSSSKVPLRSSKAPGQHVASPLSSDNGQPILGNLETPARPGGFAEDKENETPSTTGSRGAKTKAAARLHELAPDIALYEKQKKRVGGVIFGGRPTEDEIVQPQSAQKRSKRVGDSEETAPPAKRTKSTKEPAKMRLLVTGHPVWSNNKKLFIEEKEKLRALGIALTENPLECTHVAAPKILRTPKFLVAVSRAPMILHVNFIVDCIRDEALLNVDDYVLDDGDGEGRWDIQLASVRHEARLNKGNLLRGQPIFVTEDIKGGFDTYKSIVDANGGVCLLFKGRAGLPGVVSKDNEWVGKGRQLYLLCGEKPPQQKLREKFNELAAEAGKEPRVVEADWLLNVALSQRVVPSSEFEVEAMS